MSEEFLEKMFALSSEIGGEIKKIDGARQAYFLGREGSAPKAGEIWRGVKGNVSILFLVLNIESNGLGALGCPVTFEPVFEDERCLVRMTPNEGVLLPFSLTLWLGFARIVNRTFLDKPVEDLGGKAILDILEGKLPTGYRIGKPIPSIFHNEASLRAELLDDVIFLSAKE